MTVEDRLTDIVCEHLAVNKAMVTRNTSFVEDIGADSLDLVELVMEVEEAFDVLIPDDEAEHLRTVGQAADWLTNRLRARGVEAVQALEGEALAHPIATAPVATNSSLSDDLGRYAHEFYTKGDLDAGRKILAEVGGLIALGGLMVSAFTMWLPAVGISISAGTITHVVVRVGIAYERASAAERKQIRSAITWIKGGFSLGDRLIG